MTVIVKQLTLWMLFAFSAGLQASDHFDFLLVGGKVFDGTSAGAREVAVGIKGDRILYVGLRQEATDAAVVIDVTGLIVAPGFIDPHTHAYGERPATGPDFLASYTTQGVTTILSGNDGGGPVDTKGSIAAIAERGIGANFGLFVGHGSIRRQIVGMADREASPDELEQMKRLVAEAMEAGALGLSSGLFYAPGSFAPTEELVELAKVAARFGGIYESHLRDESNYSIGVVGSVKEALEIGRLAEIPVHIAHIKALGVDVWGQSDEIISLIEQAQAEGQRVTADQYPWLASGTRISNALIPRSAMGGGETALHARLRDSAQLPALKVAMAENLRRRGGANSILLTDGSERWRGLTLEQYAEQENTSAIDAAVQIVLDGDAKIASFNMNPEDLEAFMARPWVLTSSDGGDGHPRKFASFPQKYREFVMNKHVLSLGDFIHRSTGLTAETFGIKDRGVLREGAFADVVVFDPETFGPRATYEKPDIPSIGVQYLFINGQPSIWNGKSKEQTSGRLVVGASAHQD